MNVPRVDFAYRRVGFVLTTALLSIVAAFMIIFFADIGSDVYIMSLVVVLSLAMVFLYGIAPMLTKHSLDNDDLVLRQGVFFKATIPRSSIVKVERIEQGPLRTGAYLVIGKKSLFVTSRRNDLIRIRLRQPQRFGTAFGRMAETVTFDCMDIDVMYRALSAPLTPANPSLSS